MKKINLKIDLDISPIVKQIEEVKNLLIPLDESLDRLTSSSIIVKTK